MTATEDRLVNARSMLRLRGWTQGAHYRHSGRPGDAIRHDLLGALIACGDRPDGCPVGEDQYPDWLYEQAWDSSFLDETGKEAKQDLEQVILDRYGHEPSVSPENSEQRYHCTDVNVDLVAFNDHPQTTSDDVLGVLWTAIRLTPTSGPTL